MHAKKLGFLLSMALVASAILATRIQEVDVPIWQRFADANRVNPLNAAPARRIRRKQSWHSTRARRFLYATNDCRAVHVCAALRASAGGYSGAFTDHERRRGAFADLQRYRLRGESRSRRG